MSDVTADVASPKVVPGLSGSESKFTLVPQKNGAYSKDVLFKIDDDTTVSAMNFARGEVAPLPPGTRHLIAVVRGEVIVSGCKDFSELIRATCFDEAKAGSVIHGAGMMQLKAVVDSSCIIITFTAVPAMKKAAVKASTQWQKETIGESAIFTFNGANASTGAESFITMEDVERLRGAASEQSLTVITVVMFATKPVSFTNEGPKYGGEAMGRLKIEKTNTFKLIGALGVFSVVVVEPAPKKKQQQLSQVVEEKKSSERNKPIKVVNWLEKLVDANRIDMPLYSNSSFEMTVNSVDVGSAIVRNIDTDEIIMVIEGRASVDISLKDVAGRRFEVGPGSSLEIPPSIYKLYQVGPEKLKYIRVSAKADEEAK